MLSDSTNLFDRFPGQEDIRSFIKHTEAHAFRSRSSKSQAPATPYQFTVPIMAWIYWRMQKDAYHKYNQLKNALVLKTVERKAALTFPDRPKFLFGEKGVRASPFSPEIHVVASQSPLRAVAYFSWHNDRKLFITRRVYPTYFDFFSLSFVDEGWGALGHLLDDVDKGIIKANVFSTACDIPSNHRFLPFLKEAERLNYRAALVIPVFTTSSGERSKTALKGAMVFYVSDKGSLPRVDDKRFQIKARTFATQIGKLVRQHERQIQSPLSANSRRKKKTDLPSQWRTARKNSNSSVARKNSKPPVVFARVRIIDVDPVEKDKIALDVQSALSGGDFVCHPEAANCKKNDLLRFWVTCLDKGRSPTVETWHAFAEKLKRTIAQAIANASTDSKPLKMEVVIHGPPNRHTR